MTITPTSSIALAVQSVIDLVANSPTFQARMSEYHYHGESVDAAKAKNHIYGFDQFDTLEGSREMRPFAIVGLMEHTMTPMAQCSQLNHRAGGTIFLVICDTARHTNILGETLTGAHNATYLDALNWIGGTIDDLTGPAIATVPFPPQPISTQMEPTRPDVSDRQEDDFWLAVYSLQFGETGGGGG